jgi:MoaA/NifB/PqqE/SkfB family radical SAM enzyme
MIYNEANFDKVMTLYKRNAHDLTARDFDHTIYYCLDTVSNTKLFRHFLEYPWEDWDGKTVIEVGAGFGIYTLLFNLIKEYYDIDIKIVSIDCSEGKIESLKTLAEDMCWTNNDFICGDATDETTFALHKWDNVALIYSETFGKTGETREPYFDIINTIHKTFMPQYELFPKDFILDSENNIEAVKIQGKYFYFEHEEDELTEYISKISEGKMGPRWGWGDWFGKRKTFQDFKSQWYISLTEKCNWHCSYCDFPTKAEQKPADLEYIIQTFDAIKKATNADPSIEYMLEGGEIGLMSEYDLDKIFHSGLAETYTVTTNGLFMERGYHERYKDKIHYILYHVKPDLFLPFSFKEYDVDPSIMVQYTFVITKQNLKLLPYVLEQCENVKHFFQPHILQPRREGLDFLTKEDFEFLYDTIKDSLIIREHFKERVQRIIERFDDEKWLDGKRALCSNVYTQPIFDIPNKKINRCCISITGDAVDITPENIEKLYTNKRLFSTIKDKVCDGCIANFLWHDFRHKERLKEVVRIFKDFA